MAIQFKRGDTAANDAHTGLNAELTIDFEGETIRVHDGNTAGGAFSVGISGVGDGNTNLSVNYATDSFTVTSSTGTNATVDAATPTQAGAMSAADKEKLDGIESGAQANVGDEFDEGGDYEGLRARATTSDDVGLGSVENYGIASTEQAEQASSNEVYMTPLRVSELLASGNFSIDFGEI